jgi:iron complex transport system permease protein
LLIADTAARTIAAPNELPIGLITALIGAPVLILVLRKSGEVWR